jgi:methyl-accepting chemotaxis protein
MLALAEGDLDTPLPQHSRRDEIGEMAEAVQAFKDAALEKLRVEAAADRQSQASEAERRSNDAERTRTAAAQALVVEQVADGLSHLAQGDLTCRLTRPFAPEYEGLRRDFNAAMSQLETTVGVIADATRGINGGAAEISSAAESLSRRTEQQAAALEETAAALDEITATVRRSAVGAKAADAAVREAGQDTGQGRAVVRDAVSAMSRIEQSAQEISQIIGVIDEIAFQTNLLALNAGVEAARAGDAGKGFAVVASEVKNLATQTGKATEEIIAQINAIQSTTGSSVAAIAAIGQTINRVNEIANSIAAAVEEQGAATQEIARNVQEAARGTSEVSSNVAGVAEAAKKTGTGAGQVLDAAQHLSQQAETLRGAVDQFLGRIRAG